MYRRDLLTMFLGAGLGPLAACGGGSSESPGAPPPAMPTASDWASVIDAMLDVLGTAHVEPWRRVSQASFAQQADALKLRINSLPPQLAAVEAMALIAVIGDGHTNLITWNLHRWLGLGFLSFADGLFVASTSASLQHLLGAQVLRLGELSAPQALAQAARLWPAENPSAERAWGPWLASSINALRWMGAATGTQEVAVTLRRPGSATEEVLLAQADSNIRVAPTFEPQAMALQHREFQRPGVAYWHEWIEPTRCLYFRYQDCRDAPAFAAFASQMFAALDALPARCLVVDLRGNRGGDSAVWQPFLQGLAARANRPGVMQPGGLRFITDRYTFSAAVDASIDLLQLQALHVGEAPGQSPNFLGNVVTRALTSLNIGMNYPTRISRRVPGDPPSLVPAAPVLRSSGDYMAGRDPALDRAMA